MEAAVISWQSGKTLSIITHLGNFLFCFSESNWQSKAHKNCYNNFYILLDFS